MRVKDLRDFIIDCNPPEDTVYNIVYGKEKLKGFVCNWSLVDDGVLGSVCLSDDDSCVFDFLSFIEDNVVDEYTTLFIDTPSFDGCQRLTNFKYNSKLCVFESTAL